MLLIAHRGASGLAPENTLKAFHLALEQGVAAIELDVQYADGELWVFHDRRLERCTNGHGVLTRQSREYLAGLDAGDGEPIPTLWQVMTLVAGRCDLHIELKGPDTAQPVAELMRRAEIELKVSPQRWLVSSFDHRELLHFQRLRPEVRLGALIAGVPRHLARFAAEMGCWSINCDVDFVDGELVNDAHTRGLKVLVYTVDRPEEWQWLAEIGVDGIFTNHPERATLPSAN
ncbi:glycerophosphodiester phosphodiesterase [Aeromonas schubertii]|uniref:glycerophosphodiester phosphodiesterase n=1 Tax=Aeromonas schubertii TaxID=652 RepID=UPI001CC4CE76|nr:glycerophosphodiester phosphodiesterase family protein [Aeromonas schubertii]MBZ6072277.1 glycerophosphodiester phosphodiesterase [Aeromonas schubertii]